MGYIFACICPEKVSDEVKFTTVVAEFDQFNVKCFYSILL